MINNIHVGIDPGLSGGIAALLTSLEHKTPVLLGARRVKRWQLTKKAALIDVDEVMGFFRDYAPAGRIDSITIEQVASHPRQGVASTFTFGRATGTLEACAHIAMRAGHSGPNDVLRWVAPTKWKREVGLPVGADKRDSLALANKLYPEHAGTWGVLANDGLAEAALIATWRIANPRRLDAKAGL